MPQTAGSPARVLVTGGAGFIGANLVRRLVARGCAVSVIDDLSTGNAENLDGLPVRFVQGSILQPDALSAAMTGVASVVHLAARPSVPRSLADPVASHHANATGTLMVLEQARAHGCHVTVASSSSVYGRNPTLPKSERLATQPASPYAVTKLATEGYALAYAASFALRVIAFRFFNVFGPLQPAGHAYAAVIPAFVDAALSGRPLVVHGDGLQSRDFTFVDTVTEILALAVADHVVHDSPVNLAFGTRSTLLEVVELLRRQTGRELVVDHVEPRAGDVRHSQADNSLLRTLFPGVAPVPLDQGLAQTVEWFYSSKTWTGVPTVSFE
jgi:UDP-glucose 4-epimerase